ncbi:hypothetical protein [Amycolatopsis thermophila]|uniref:Uncharacterized protein n=1 Tax=Amycolatopsis thermophila TaxID=206084 RepID=A0ABU0ELH2_9PSEU|nr:hypothetical protein [Amycolatopsis thermophila]MDQ0376130.1 hypothetical protein [Amycolatopsis thermophila]
MQNWAARSHRELADAVRCAEGPIAAAARAAMPEPVDFDLDATLTRLFGKGGTGGPAEAAADLRAGCERARAAHERAVRVVAAMTAAFGDHDVRRSDPPVPSAPVITGAADSATHRPGAANSPRLPGTWTTGPAIPGSGGPPCGAGCAASGRG